MNFASNERYDVDQTLGLNRVQDATQKRDKGKDGDNQTSDPGAVLLVAEEVSAQLKRSTEQLTDDLKNLTSTANSITSSKKHLESRCEKRDNQPTNFYYVDRLLKEVEALDMG
ncbi:unnamed protein product [Schistocephalus solidus]|uniref:t-SNARE coiled-coil homology domain-containing protein n=1 Tax=Schistocephalus solidus TaxID=70667 RepID=A0A183SKX5_SCHSO|nr:unnamed protein product [Schistocephalus solidus]